MKPFRALCVLGTIALAVGCHNPAPGPTPAPVVDAETPCWWTVYRSELPVDTVAGHLVSAFTALGLSAASSERHGDTVWTHAGPTRIASRFGGTFSARAVAFRRGDSTLYRYFLTASPPAAGWRKGYDSVTATHRFISVNPAASALAMCVDVAALAHNGGKAPKEPNGEETLAIWSSAPGPRAIVDPIVPAGTPAVAGVVVVALPRPLEPVNGDSIVLERTRCFGVCPAYRLRIARSGEVLFQPRTAGDTTHSLTSITSEAAHRLFEAAGRLGFEALPDTISSSSAYCHNWPTDYPSAITTVFVGDRSKRVDDYLGCDWAPVGLRRLEAMIDSVAGTQRLLARRLTR